MNAKHNAADRVRPILKAMERSIEAARNTRTQPVKPPAAIASHHLTPPLAPAAAPAAVPGGRLKARPKRSWM